MWAIVAAIALTLRQRKDTKHTNPSDQVRVKARDRMEIIKMKVTTQPLAADPGVAAAGLEK